VRLPIGLVLRVAVEVVRQAWQDGIPQRLAVRVVRDVLRQGLSPQRHGWVACSVCGALCRGWDAEPFHVHGGPFPWVERRWHHRLPCGHTVLAAHRPA